ncbi:MAG: DNA repair protein RadC [Pseudomonadota bacterium]
MCGTRDIVPVDDTNVWPCLSDLEILEAVFSPVMKNPDRGLTCHTLLDHFGSANRVLLADDDELARVVHIDNKALRELSRVRRLVNCVLLSDIEGRPLLDNLDAVCKFGRAKLACKTREELHAIFLDESYHLLSHERIQTGTINHVAVYPREIMACALRKNARHIILFHNHPGGAALPSDSDLEATKRLADAGRTIDVSILDHIIIGARTEFSFRKNGLMSFHSKNVTGHKSAPRTRQVKLKASTRIYQIP